MTELESMDFIISKSVYIIYILLISLSFSLFLNAVRLAIGDGMIFGWLRKWLDSVFIDKHKTSKWRNEDGLLYIAKPIYSCISCMPPLWSLSLLLFFPITDIIFVSLLSIPIATIIYDLIW